MERGAAHCNAAPRPTHHRDNSPCYIVGLPNVYFAIHSYSRFMRSS